MLKDYINEKRQKKDILLMTHIVIGYPNIQTSYEIIDSMVKAGVDLIELQIPFSEPMADGPVILHANQKALANGITVQECMEFAENIAQKYDIPFLFMSYYNILFKYGLKTFISKMKEIGLYGAIVPDIPPEEGEEYISLMKKNNLAPIYIFSPSTTDDRMKFVQAQSDGFIYSVARKGVTGANTEFSQDLDEYIERCNKSTDLPIALGFGVKSKEDIEYLSGKVDIAVIGSEIIRIIDNGKLSDIEKFIKQIGISK